MDIFDLTLAYYNSLQATSTFVSEVCFDIAVAASDVAQDAQLKKAQRETEIARQKVERLEKREQILASRAVRPATAEEVQDIAPLFAQAEAQAAG